jgi:hypothetical protein
MKVDDQNPLEDMVKKAGLHTIEDHYDDVVFRWGHGVHITEQINDAIIEGKTSCCIH